MSRYFVGASWVAGMFLIGAALLTGTAWAASNVALRSAPPPTLGTVPATVLQQSGIELEAPAPDPPWCPLAEALPERVLGSASGACPSAGPSRQAATRLLARLGRVPREMVLADCSVHRPPISHRRCWVAPVDYASTRPLPAGAATVAAPVIGRGGARSALVDFVDAAGNRLLAEIRLSWGGQPPPPIPLPKRTPV